MANHSIKIEGFCYPNGKTDKITRRVEEVSETLGQCLVIATGANDAYEGALQTFCQNMKKALRTAHSLSRLIILVTIPFRRDLPLGHEVNFNILEANIQLNDLAQAFKNVVVVDATVLPEKFSSKYGIHLNQKGKKHLGSIIYKKCKSFSSTNQVTNLQSNINNQNNNAEVEKENKIKVSVADMREIIEGQCKDATLAFAHCVSADLKMGAGVAKVFRHKFGKPSREEHLSPNLAYQEVVAGAGVYSLVTKPYYYNKVISNSAKEDYNKAFECLEEDFKKRGYKTLVCSPMACIRDQVSVQHFCCI